MQAQAVLIQARHKARAALRARQLRRQAEWLARRVDACTLAAQDVGAQPEDPREVFDGGPACMCSACREERLQAQDWWRLQQWLTERFPGCDEAAVVQTHRLGLRPGAAELGLALALMRQGATWTPSRQRPAAA